MNILNRYKDCLDQADKDLKATTDSEKSGHYEWVCFQSQQAAEKALKSLLLYLNIDSWGHYFITFIK